MDLKDFKPKTDTVEVILHAPYDEDEILTDNDGNEFTIVVYASHTPEFKASQQKNVDKWLKLQQKKVKKTPTLEELEDSEVDHLARITVSWDIFYDGEKPKLTIDKAKELYKEIFWIREQIKEALEESADFTRN